MFSYLDGATGVAYRIVSALDTLIAPLAGGASTAVAIVLLAMAVRLLLLPLAYAALRGEFTRAACCPALRSCASATPGTRPGSTGS